MKLAEALILRSDMQKKLARSKERMQNNVLIQEGDEAAENVNDLMKDFISITNEMSKVIKRINKTNIETEVCNGITIAEMIVDRDMQGKKFSMFNDMASKATVESNRWGRNEIKFVSTVNVSDLRKKADAAAQKFREIDTAIQSKNWTTELM